MSTVVRQDARSSIASQSRATAGLGPPPKRLYVLDGLRLIAALMVVGFHYIGFDSWWRSPWGRSTAVVFPTAHPIAAYGWLGVELFFLVSGFVICMSCWGRTPRQFAVSRLVRLYPAYWFAVLLTTAVLVLRPGGWDIRMSEFLSNLTMFQEPLGARDVDPVYWSLWAELRFYLLFGVVAVMGLTYRRVVVFCAVWLLAVVLAPHSGIDLLEVLAAPSAAPFFIGGVVIYLMHRFGPRPALWLLLAASWLLAQDQLTSLVRHAQHSVHGDLSWGVSLGVITASFGLVLAAALGRLDFFNWRWLTTAGAMTYPLYLLHEEIGWEVIRYSHELMNPWVLLAVLVSAMMLAAWMVNRWIERPGARRLKAWLAPRPPVAERAA